MDTPETSLTDQPAHDSGRNGEVLNRIALPTMSKASLPRPQKDSLRIAAPAFYRLSLAWLLAGFLNPSLIFWALVDVYTGGYMFMAVGLFWMVSLPSAIAVSAGMAFDRRRSVYSLGYLFKVSLKMWALVSGIAIGVPWVLALVSAFEAVPMIIGYGVLIAAIFGLPAALCAAIVVRLVVFRSKPVMPNAAPSTL